MIHDLRAGQTNDIDLAICIQLHTGFLSVQMDLMQIILAILSMFMCLSFKPDHNSIMHRPVSDPSIILCHNSMV